MRISDWSSDVCSSDLLSDRYLLQSRPRRCIDETRRGHRDVALVSGDPPAFARPARLYSRDRKGSRDAADRTGGIGRPDSEIDRKNVVEGKSVSVRVDLGGRRLIKKKTKKKKKK